MDFETLVIVYFVLISLANITALTYLWAKNRLMYKLAYISALASTQMLTMIEYTNQIMHDQHHTSEEESTGVSNLYS